MIRRAGELGIPFTSGILIGIGETPAERVEALLALRDLHDEGGHIQEVIVQNFRAKPDTPMAGAGEPGLVELMTACAIARLVMGPAMSVQAPPNLSADYGPLLLAGINDWGGVSPLTPDFVNPEAPWPELGRLERALRRRRLRPARAAHDLPRVPGRRPLPRPGHARPRARHGRRRRARARAGACGRPRGWPRERHLLPPRRAGRAPAGARDGPRGGRPRRGRRRRARSPQGLLPVETAAPGGPAIAWVVDPAGAMALHEPRGGRLAHHAAPRGPARGGARRARAQRRRLPAHRPRSASRRRSSSAGCRAIATRVSLPVASLEEALDAIAAGAVDLVVGDWGPDQVGALRDALAPRAAGRAHRPAARDRDRRRPRRPAAAALHRLAGAGQRLRGGAAALQLGAGPRRGAAGAGAAAVGRVGGRRLGRRRARARTWAALAPDLAGILERSLEGRPPRVDEIERLFRARGPEVEAVAAVADELRRERCGEVVTYVVNRNINYTNQCYFRCGFCGFSRGPKSLNLRGDPYILEVHEVVHRSVEAWERGATEVCLQGGIHPDFTGDFYVSVLEAIKARLPEMHVHGFTPLEVWQGAHTLGVSVREFLTRLRDAGPGHAAGDRRRDPRRPRARPPVPGQGAHRPSGPR